MNYQFNFSFLADTWQDLLDGLWVTLQLTFSANLIGLILGFIICLFSISKYKIFKILAQLFIEFFRCTPVLLQIIWFFYCVPFLFDIYIEPIPMGILALGLNLTAFNAEAYRAGVQAVPKEHLDASVALGLNQFKRTIYVVLPQSFRLATPVLITNAIGGLQQSSLVAIVAVSDLMYIGKTIAINSYQPLETYSIVALIYFLLSLPLSKFARILEHRQDKFFK